MEEVRTTYQRSKPFNPCLRPQTPEDQIPGLQREILQLKEKLNAVILAHNYQVPEIQDIADYVGDSLVLARQAAATKADVIVFCGVYFMAETAKILNPNRLVLIPDKEAGCSLVDDCPVEKLAKVQASNPNYYTIAYINSSAAVKARSDIICTSGNADRVVAAAPKDRDLLFVPDANLGRWAMQKTGRKMTLWDGSCHVHCRWTAEDIQKIRARYPDAVVVAHPECTAEVLALADEVCSTEGMIRFAQRTPAKKIIVVTESGMTYRLQKEFPDKIFIPAPTAHMQCNECEYMKQNTLKKLYECMVTQHPAIELPPEIIEQARRPIERMLAL